MLLWISGITCFHHVHNDGICQGYGVAPISDKLRKAHFQWYSHILHAKDNTIALKVLWLELSSKFLKVQPKGCEEEEEEKSSSQFIGVAFLEMAEEGAVICIVLRGLFVHHT